MKDTLIKEINSVVKNSRGIKKISLTMLAIDSLSATLRVQKFDKQIFNLFILRGDEQVKSCIAQNPNLTRDQWLKLLMDKNESVSLSSKLNSKFEIGDEENIFIQKIREQG